MGSQETDIENVKIGDARKAEPDVHSPDDLARAEEKHAHERTMHESEQGHIGKILGSRSEKPGNVSSIVILFCFSFAGLSFYLLDMSTQDDLFLKIISANFSIVTLALGYLFGSSDRR